jgi:hypothetical protein
MTGSDREAVVPVFRMQLDPSGLPHHPVHVSGFGGQDLGVLELDAMSSADAVFGYGRFVWIHDLFIALIMEALHTSETSVYFNETTRRYIPEGSTLHTRSRETLKSHIDGNSFNRNFVNLVVD